MELLTTFIAEEIDDASTVYIKEGADSELPLSPLPARFSELKIYF